MTYVKKKFREEPINFDGENVYQLWIKSRGLQWLAIRDVFHDLNIVRLVIDGFGKGEYHETRERINYNGSCFYVRGIHDKRVRFGGRGFGIIKEDEISLNKVYESLKDYEPRTAFIKEMECRDDKRGIILLFKDRFVSDKRIRAAIEKSKDTHSSPLFLQRIYDLESLKEIKQRYFYKKVAPIQKTEIRTEGVIGFTIVDDD